MAENNKTGQGQDQRQRTAPADIGKPHKPAGTEKPVGNTGSSGNRDVGGDPNKNKMSPGIEQDRNRQSQGNQGSQGQGMGNPNKMSPDKDRVAQDVDLDDEDRATQRTQRPDLDRDDSNPKG